MLELALSYYGTQEIKGSDHNPIISKFLSTDHDIIADEIPWCSAFLNYIAKESGLVRSKSLAARSWQYVGEEVKDPIPGDIVVFWRGFKKGWKGHVGIYIRESGRNVYVLGGNQDNKVNIKPYAKSRVLAYRRLVKEEVKTVSTTKDYYPHGKY